MLTTLEECYKVEWVPGMTLQALKLLVAQSALEAAEGNRTLAAKNLGVCPRTMRTYVKELRTLGYDVPPPAMRGPNKDY